METSLFADPKRAFVVTLFIEGSELARKMSELEALGNRKNVTLTIQPCPYEGIEFLYRVGKDLAGHFVSLEKDVFWEALELLPKTNDDIKKEIAEHHLGYLTAILRQDPPKVREALTKLKGLEENFTKPLEVG